MIYVIWYLSSAHWVYAAINLNYPVVIFYLLVCILQARLRKSKKYIDFANNIIQARKGLREVSLTYDEKIK